jgi:hypothetical protein
VDGDRVRLSRKAILIEKRIEAGGEAPPGYPSGGTGDRPQGPRRPSGGGQSRRNQPSRHR